MWIAALRAIVKQPASWFVAALVVIVSMSWCAGVRHQQATDAAHATRAGRDTVRAHAAPMQQAVIRYVHDTVRIHSAVSYLVHDTAWVHDTVTVAGDTAKRLAVPVATVDSARSLIRACAEVTNDCATFKREATATIKGLQLQLANTPPPRSCVMPALTWAGVGAGVAAVLIRR